MALLCVTMAFPLHPIQLSPEAVVASTAVADNPQWTCGVIVDGQLSCAGELTSCDHKLARPWQKKPWQKALLGTCSAATGPQGPHVACGMQLLSSGWGSCVLHLAVTDLIGNAP